MDTNKTSRVLGLAFLLQFITSFSNGVLLRSAWLVPGDIGATMLRIAANPAIFQASLLLDLLTAMGVAFLGACLFIALRGQGERIALTGLALYLLEAALLAASRGEGFALLRLSQAYVAAGQPALWQTTAAVALGSMDFVGSTLHMLAFCLGAIMFYPLLYRAQLVPRWMSLWGLVTVFPMLVGSVTQIFGYTLPFFWYLPYVPFELVIGVWILVKGVPEKAPALGGGSPQQLVPAAGSHR